MRFEARQLERPSHVASHHTFILAATSALMHKVLQELDAPGLLPMHDPIHCLRFIEAVVISQAPNIQDATDHHNYKNISA
jgi:hypothetical protein